MTKTLFLLRHAKADRPAAIDDFERPLNERGRKAAPKIGAVMAERGWRPDLALVSPAKRTRETWALIARALGDGKVAEFHDQLYLASATRLLEIVRAQGEAIASVLIVGHNPGIEELAARLAAEPQPPAGARALSRLKTKYPTGALTIIGFNVDHWKQVRAGSGLITEFLTPAMIDD